MKAPLVPASPIVEDHPEYEQAEVWADMSEIDDTGDLEEFDEEDFDDEFDDDFEEALEDEIDLDDEEVTDEDLEDVDVDDVEIGEMDEDEDGFPVEPGGGEEEPEE